MFSHMNGLQILLLTEALKGIMSNCLMPLLRHSPVRSGQLIPQAYLNTSNLLLLFLSVQIHQVAKSSSLPDLTIHIFCA